MFGKYAAFIIPSYLATALVMIGITLWIVMVYRKRQREIAQLEAKGIRRGGAPAQRSDQ
jgi:heme exporter protein D